MKIGTMYDHVIQVLCKGEKEREREQEEARLKDKARQGIHSHHVDACSLSVCLSRSARPIRIIRTPNYCRSRPCKPPVLPRTMDGPEVEIRCDATHTHTHTHSHPLDVLVKVQFNLIPHPHHSTRRWS